VRMEITAVVEAVLTALTPFLPLLKRIGEGAVDQATDEIGNRIDAKGWEFAKDLWFRLRHRVASDPALKQATDDLAAVPADPAAQKALQHHLQRLLNNDAALLAELEHLLTAKAATQQVNVADELNIGVQAGSIGGGRVSGIGKQSGSAPVDDS
jgi:hypothetical protein